MSEVYISGGLCQAIFDSRDSLKGGRLKDVACAVEVDFHPPPITFIQIRSLSRMSKTGQ